MARLSRSKATGSSPLARGTLGPLLSPCILGRFIPAGAGNTSPVSSRSGRRSVHPRWRGEHLGGFRHRPTVGGSSPLARGTLGELAPARRDRRFIPAGAGNTPAQRCGCGHDPVHPRWRGEHPTRTKPRFCERGSSPLARGTRHHVRPQGEVLRFIPAGAGNTPRK